MDAIDKAIDRAGGLAKLADHLAVTYQAIQYWRRGGVPPQYWAAIQDKTGVTRDELYEQYIRAKGAE